MNILVLLKQTFDTEENIVIENGQISEENVEFIMNPYDEYAVEEAVKIKEEIGAEITAITLGPSRTASALRTALAMGADQAVLIEWDEQEADEWTASNLIAAVVKNRDFDLILGGNMAIDSGSGQVAIRVAEKLGIPHVSTITKLTLNDGTATVERDVEGDVEIVEIQLPFLATTQQGLNEPRYPSLPGIMKAKKKPLKTFSVEELSLENEDVTTATVIIDQYLPAKKQAGQILEGELQDQVSELVQILQNAAKVV
ncbi:electron transfer flavoprotein beta subunit [Scopulibacillus darangshiensis]|uniref:Electron transfer flavoprotein subunit beta n=1 Tax=Scopulibacillus darangshiensis TaxID=442528 RepID=A0A4R2NUL2_9BACL|nr:electron transfer flavoprotein subunit beta/FixA family protein [Scopulibacillus darangshiensis]TCP25607.1 electron transfer flavoprotein beta subunit [Scopulibacillus darangshiensis]